MKATYATNYKAPKVESTNTRNNPLYEEASKSFELNDTTTKQTIPLHIKNMEKIPIIHCTYVMIAHRKCLTLHQSLHQIQRNKRPNS